MLFFASAADIVIPFHLLQTHIPLLVVNTTVNGNGPYHFIVDTGNSAFPVIVSISLANKLDLKMTEDPTDHFAVGLDRNIRLTTLGQVNLGDVEEKEVHAGVSAALDQLTRSAATTIDGNLGGAFFKNYVLTVDYAHSQLRLGSNPVGNEGIEFRASKRKPLILIDVLANGKALTFAVDTGASSSVISKDAAKALGLSHGIEMPLNATSEMGYVTSIPSLRVGDATFKDVSVVAAGFLTELSERAGSRIDGVIGYNVLSTRTLTIDYPRHRLSLTGPAK